MKVKDVIKLLEKENPEDELYLGLPFANKNISISRFGKKVLITVETDIDD